MIFLLLFFFNFFLFFFKRKKEKERERKKNMNDESDIENEEQDDDYYDSGPMISEEERKKIYTKEDIEKEFQYFLDLIQKFFDEIKLKPCDTSLAQIRANKVDYHEISTPLFYLLVRSTHRMVDIHDFLAKHDSSYPQSSPPVFKFAWSFDIIRINIRRKAFRNLGFGAKIFEYILIYCPANIVYIECVQSFPMWKIIRRHDAARASRYQHMPCSKEDDDENKVVPPFSPVEISKRYFDCHDIGMSFWVPIKPHSSFD